jgi:hypothetical protein
LIAKEAIAPISLRQETEGDILPEFNSLSHVIRLTLQLLKAKKYVYISVEHMF